MSEDMINRSLNELIAAAKSVIERWDSPAWKDLPATADYIHRLRKAVTNCNQLVSSEIPSHIEIHIALEISRILATEPHHKQLDALLAAFRPYLRTSEPVSLAQAASGISFGKDSKHIASKVLDAAGVKYVD